MTNQPQLLDVRQIPPPQRHGLIFQTFDALPPGQAFILINDHEPKPLYYQFQAECTGRFTWDYLEQGPDVWRVQVGKTEPKGQTTMDYTYIAGLMDQVSAIPSDSILSRTVYSDEQLKTILFAFAPGQELSEHTAAQTAVLHFLEGEADLTLGDDRLEAKAGTWVRMPPHLPHSIVAKNRVLMLLMMFKGAGQ
jgi:uncharacterized protein (DUF2249 family)